MLRSRLLAAQDTKLVRGFQRTAGMVGHAIVGRPQTTTSRTYARAISMDFMDVYRFHLFTSKNVL